MRTIKEYLSDDFKLEKWQIIGGLFLIVVLAGMFGWLYEVIFYYFNSGMKQVYMRGGNFLPWINIYATGSVMIILLSYKYRKNPLTVFLIAFISTGLLEYFSGWVIYEFFGGLRLWDYNTEILNFGNIGGFVCLRSVGFFGLSSLILMYLMVPFCIFLSRKLNKKVFLTISIILFSLFMFDELYNLIIARVFSLPRATDIYKNIGLPYMKYYRYK